MNKAKISQIRKRDSSIVPFNTDKIQQAIYKVLVATGSDDAALADIKSLEGPFFKMMSSPEFLPNTQMLMNAGAPLGQLKAVRRMP